jgi:uncharacterized protein (TIGR02118 family)
MIRIVYLLHRKPGTGLEEFHRYWRDTHAPLVASHAKHLEILRYTQSHRLDDPANQRMQQARGGMETEYDGVAELWWESEETLRNALATADGQAAGVALLADEERFIDLPNSPLWLSHEYPQVNPTPEELVARPNSGIVKLHFPLRFRSDLDADAARTYWRTQHGPLIRSHAAASGILRYLQVHRFDSGLETELRESRGTRVAAYDGHAEVWFDRSVAVTGREVAAAERAAIEDEAKFIDFKRSTMWLGKEHVIIDRR